MKLCIDTNNNKKYFVGNIPEGWRELTSEEVQEIEAVTQQLAQIKLELYSIYDIQDEYLKLQFEPVRVGVESMINAGQYDKVISILTSPYLPESIKPIAQLIYNKFITLIGGN